MAYVSEYGNYGKDEVIVFDESEFTLEQWALLEQLGDNDKFDFTAAVLNGEDLSDWE
jgi:hypothetical protein